MERPLKQLRDHQFSGLGCEGVGQTYHLGVFNFEQLLLGPVYLLSNAFEELLEDLDLFTTLDGSQLPVTEITEEWIDTVNLQRLANNPVKLDRDSMRELVLKSW